MTSNILITDDHLMFAEGIQSLLDAEANLKVSNIVSDGFEVIEHLKEHETHLILLDINMPNLDGIETLTVLKKDYPEVKVIMLTMYNEYRFIEQIMLAGAHGYLLKNTGKTELLEAIHRVLDGGFYFGKKVMETYMENLQKQKKGDHSIEAIQLTERETEILLEICNELTTSAIAEKLFISPHTVESHRKNLLSKTGAKNSVGLVKFAVQTGIIDTQL